MNLLMSEIQPAAAQLDRALPWTDDLDDEPVYTFVEPGAAECDEPPLPGRRPAWYEPRLAALRQWFAGR